MKENVAFLMKDLVLFAVSMYLLRQDVRMSVWTEQLSKDVSVPLLRSKSSAELT